MNDQAWFEQNPRLESGFHAATRERAEWREVACSEPGCGAGVGAECINKVTGLPFKGGVSHPRRIREAEGRG